MKTKPQIFISYVREDEKKVANLYQKLSAERYKPWMDTKDILPGENWKYCIHKAIVLHDVFVAKFFFISENCIMNASS